MKVVKLGIGLLFPLWLINFCGTTLRKKLIRSCYAPGFNVSLGCTCVGRPRLDRFGFLGLIRVGGQGGYE